MYDQKTSERPNHRLTVVYLFEVFITFPENWFRGKSVILDYFVVSIWKSNVLILCHN